MDFTATSSKKFKVSKTDSPNKLERFIGKVTANHLNVRSWAGKKYKETTFSPLKKGDRVSVCDAILADDKKTWYYIRYDGKYGFVSSEYILQIPKVVTKLLTYLDAYHKYIKNNYKHFINKYDLDMVSFAKAKNAVAKKKSVGITCVVPLRWALYELGVKNSEGTYLISASGGSFEKYYTGVVKTFLKRLVAGKPIGMTVVSAIDGGYLRDGDIVCFKNLTHTATYSGKGYKFYEGGDQCVRNGHYPDGILLDYSKNYYKDKKISEVLRWKG